MQVPDIKRSPFYVHFPVIFWTGHKWVAKDVYTDLVVDWPEGVIVPNPKRDLGDVITYMYHMPYKDGKFTRYRKEPCIGTIIGITISGGFTSATTNTLQLRQERYSTDNIMYEINQKSHYIFEKDVVKE